MKEFNSDSIHFSPCCDKIVSFRGWRDGSAVQNADGFSRGPRFNFNSQHSYGSSQLTVAVVPGDLTPLHRHTFSQNTETYELKRNHKKEIS